MDKLVQGLQAMARDAMSIGYSLSSAIGEFRITSDDVKKSDLTRAMATAHDFPSFRVVKLGPRVVWFMITLTQRW